MTRHLYRWRKKIVLAAAMLPIFQATGTCDPFALNSLIGEQIANSTLNLVYGSFVSTLASSFPGADLLQMLLGGSPFPIVHR
jgi:hypothetical protein